jgi:hypothetical protein
VFKESYLLRHWKSTGVSFGSSQAGNGVNLAGKRGQSGNMNEDELVNKENARRLTDMKTSPELNSQRSRSWRPEIQASKMAYRCTKKSQAWLVMYLPLTLLFIELSILYLSRYAFYSLNHQVTQ